MLIRNRGLKYTIFYKNKQLDKVFKIFHIISKKKNTDHTVKDRNGNVNKNQKYIINYDKIKICHIHFKKFILQIH